ncbi:hypothetical protein [Haladaptatus cibarius]|uniref:hypothetical protein n=1 Tax=Haladaptatus cibarius TaxID=453847 RepID=UPI000679289E|nr:hypothetical protein [Haladaptatus cibarius]
MNRLLRHAIALLVSIVVTGSVAFFESPTDESLILLVGIASVYGVGTAVALQYGSLLRSTDGPNWLSGAFAGVMTFGCLSLLNGVTPTPNFTVMVLGYGLSIFGFISGVGFEHERETE